MFDEIDFVCPTYESWEAIETHEYYIIHQVSNTQSHFSFYLFYHKFPTSNKKVGLILVNYLS